MTAFVDPIIMFGPVVPVIMQIVFAVQRKKSRETIHDDSYSANIAANRAPITAVMEPTVWVEAAPGNGVVERLDEAGLVPLGAEPDGAGAVPDAEVVGNGGAGEVEALLVTAALVSSLAAELVFSGEALGVGELDTTASEVGEEATAAVVEAGAAGVVDAGAALAVAAHPHTAAADD